MTLSHSASRAPGVSFLLEPAGGNNTYVHLGIWNPTGSKTKVVVGHVGFSEMPIPVNGDPVELVGVWPVMGEAERLNYLLDNPTWAMSGNRLYPEVSVVQTMRRVDTRVIDPATQPALLRSYVDRDNPYSEDNFIVLPPGTGLIAITDNDNQLLAVSFRWIEYEFKGKVR